MRNCDDWRMEQTGFRVQSEDASDIFEVEAAARDCYQRLVAAGIRAKAFARFREVYQGRVVEEHENPAKWAE